MTFQFTVNETTTEIEAPTALEAMEKANKTLLAKVPSFYGWFPAGANAYKATFGTWD